MDNEQQATGTAKDETPVIPKNCLTCNRLGFDDDGGDYVAHSWPVCLETYLVNGVVDRTEMEGFPFENEQPCHIPDFWKYLELDEELGALFDEEMKVPAAPAPAPARATRWAPRSFSA